MCILLTMLVLTTMTSFNTMEEGVKTYVAKKISHDLEISGSGDDPAWNEAVPMRDFSYPWNEGKPEETTFRALHDKEWVYFLFRVKDDHVLVYTDRNEKGEVAASSRVEIFFRKDEKLDPYYCLEMDPHERVLDYRATFHRKFDPSWSWPAGQLKLRAKQYSGGYSVELAITKSSLRELGLLNEDLLQAGLYRAECLNLDRNDTSFKWISWMKPDSRVPDFHIPSSFGIIRLGD